MMPREKEREIRSQKKRKCPRKRSVQEVKEKVSKEVKNIVLMDLEKRTVNE